MTIQDRVTPDLKIDFFVQNVFNHLIFSIKSWLQVIQSRLRPKEGKFSKESPMNAIICIKDKLNHLLWTNYLQISSQEKFSHLLHQTSSNKRSIQQSRKETFGLVSVFIAHAFSLSLSLPLSLSLSLSHTHTHTPPSTIALEYLYEAQ